MSVVRTVTPDYFAALGIPILRGRPFQEQDRNGSEDLMIVSDRLAKRLFPGEDAIGHRLRLTAQGKWSSIVGVAADVKNADLTGKDDPEYYLLWRNAPDFGRRRAHIMIRSAGLSLPLSNVP